MNQLPSKRTQFANSKNQMRRKMISIAYQMAWTKVDLKKAKVSADMDRIDQWCMTKGMYKCALNDHTYKELTQLVTQFEKVLKSYLTKL